MSIKQAVDQVREAKKNLVDGEHELKDRDEAQVYLQAAIAHALIAIHYDLMALVEKR